MKGLCLLDEYFAGQGDQQLSVDLMRVFLDSLNDGFARWARNYNGVVFLDDDILGCADASFCVSYCWFFLGGAVLSQSPFFYHIVLYVHPHGLRINVAAAVLGVASELQ